MKKLILFFSLFFGIFATVSAQQPAFPSAEGYGKYAKGGRGGDVYIVNSLSDDNVQGTFRHAVSSYNSTNGRTIVFNISGTIDIKSDFDYPGKTNITIAGQTSPGKGIVIRTNGKKMKFIAWKNAIVRYLRFRSGIGDGSPSGEDALTIEGSSPTDGVENFILDHCSMGWGIDGNMDMRNIKNSTVQWCIFSEALHNSVHCDARDANGVCTIIDKHAMCTSQRGYLGNMTNHHNIYASSRDRHPSFGGNPVMTLDQSTLYIDLINNMIYNWGLNGAIHPGTGYGNDSGDTKIFCGNYNFVNNIYRRGPERGGDNPFSVYTEPTALCGPNKVYISGNKYMPHPDYPSDITWAADRNANMLNFIDYGDYRKDLLTVVERQSEFLNNHISAEFLNQGTYTPIIHSADQAYDLLITKAGASLMRDKVDSSFIQSVINNTGRMIDKIEESAAGGFDPFPGESRSSNWDTDKDGLPDAWEIAKGLNPNNNSDGNYLLPDGYTVLEKYINSLTGEEPDFTLIQYTLSTNVSGNGTVSINPEMSNNKYIASTKVKLSAKPAAGNVFVNWSGDINNANQDVEIEMTANKTITANFAPSNITYLLTTDFTGMGTVTQGGSFSTGSEVTLSATPAEGYRFEKWSGDVTGTQNPVKIVMLKNLHITADFVKQCQPTPVTPVAASATAVDGANLATNAIDNNPLTRWAAQGNGATLILDLGDLFDVSSLDITWNKATGRNYNYDIACSTDGINFSKVLTNKSSDGITTTAVNIPMPITKTRYVQYISYGYTGISSGAWINITELVVNGCNIYTGMDLTTNTKSNIVVYPNPFESELAILLLVPGDATIEIFDLTGKLIVKNSYNVSSDNNNVLLNLRNLKAGMYIASIFVKNSSLTKKILISKK